MSSIQQEASSKRAVRRVCSWFPSGKKKVFSVQLQDSAYISIIVSIMYNHGSKHFDPARTDCNTFDFDFNTFLHVLKEIVRHRTPSLVRVKTDHPNTLTAIYEMDEVIGTVNYGRGKSWSTYNIDVVFTREPDGTFIASYAMPSSYNIH